MIQRKPFVNLTKDLDLGIFKKCFMPYYVNLICGVLHVEPPSGLDTEYLSSQKKSMEVYENLRILLAPKKYIKEAEEKKKKILLNQIDSRYKHGIGNSILAIGDRQLFNNSGYVPYSEKEWIDGPTFQDLRRLLRLEFSKLTDRQDLTISKPFEQT